MKILPQPDDQLTPSFCRLRLAMWILLVLLHLITSFHRVSINVMADLLMAEFSLTGVALGNLSAAYTYMYLVMQLPGGVLVDRLGPRKIALLTGMTMAIGSLMIGFAPTAWMFFLGRLTIGLGGSVILINIFKFQATWFRRNEFATMSGIALFTSSIGTLVAATPLAISIAAFGWRVSFIFFALVTFAVAAFGYFRIRNEPADESCRKALANDENGSHIKPVPVLAAIKQSLGNRSIWLLVLINTGTYGGMMVLSGTWGISYLVHSYGFTVAKASYFIISALLGYMFGAPVIGYISDRVGSQKKLVIITAICYLSAWLGIIAWPGGFIPEYFIFLLFFLLGFGSAGTMLTFPMARRVSPPGFTGSITATVNLGIFLGIAILQPLVGYLLDFNWDGLVVEGARVYPLVAYRYGFLPCLIFAFMALAAVICFREKKVREH